MLEVERVYAYLARYRWFRRVRANGRLDIGGYGYYLGTSWGNRMLELRFDPEQQCFVGQPEGSETSIMIVPRSVCGSMR